MVESNRVAEDSDTKAEEVKSSDGEDPETSDGIEGTDQSLSYTAHFANVMELYQKKNLNCFRGSSRDYLVKDWPKDLSKITQKVNLNAKEGMTKKGSQTPKKPVVTQPTSWMRLPESEHVPEISLLESWST